jgi:hypothetical protein
MPAKHQWYDTLRTGATTLTACTAALGIVGVVVWKLWAADMVEKKVVEVAATPCVVDTMIHKHVDPLTDSLIALGRRQTENAVYMTIVLEEIAGPMKARVAEQRYLAMKRAMRAGGR